ncbi:Protein arginine N-methyltransferase 7 [Zea mays]|uniref:Protein arginine N-methyltransferase 7 n=1 Tax=Zea mays TaxID=4577 RepID=A0A3L6G2Y4_MAIZE|nr:Protein arginine N-methyltransferase 7 [Zea mays]
MEFLCISSSFRCIGLAFQLCLNLLIGNTEWLVINEAETEVEAPVSVPTHHKQLLAATFYLSMLNDASRNRAYCLAIDATVTNTTSHVLDIGFSAPNVGLDLAPTPKDDNAHGRFQAIVPRESTSSKKAKGPKLMFGKGDEVEGFDNSKSKFKDDEQDGNEDEDE